MTALGRTSISGLRWVLSAVVLLQTLHFVFSPGVAQHLAQVGIVPWARPVLGWGEALAVVLFVVPATSLVGGYGLLLTFAAAIVMHFCEGDFGVGGLIVYAMCVVVCLAHRETKVGGETA